MSVRMVLLASTEEKGLPQASPLTSGCFLEISDVLGLWVQHSGSHHFHLAPPECMHEPVFSLFVMTSVLLDQELQYELIPFDQLSVPITYFQTRSYSEKLGVQTSVHRLYGGKG